uniref:CMP-N-acetylneuraminate-beta-1,4-galactoside alpha-2,3-sialyltransferase-like n=1 Tax=Saccoglossus kowalevskii TaxID=10224 RepID=A0ABM0M7S4_SACKO|nr:PREDICTED: CMP-N-acetylneuraminate-beta-1,4-galactoside alpha-2,3-sialyltransferase-like [Saccoglossus kowalevskii]
MSTISLARLQLYVVIALFLANVYCMYVYWDTWATESLMPASHHGSALVPEYETHLFSENSHTAWFKYRHRRKRFRKKWKKFLKSDFSCQRRYTQKLLQDLVPGFNASDELFLNTKYKTFKNYDQTFSETPPYGFDRKTSAVDYLLDLLLLSDYPDRFRMNNAKTVGYADDVGRKTTFRFIYPESALMDTSQYNRDSDIVFMSYKEDDYWWLASVLKKKKISGYFWKEIPNSLDKPEYQIRLLNPAIHQEARDIHLCSKKRPSTGIVAMVFAFHYCDIVDIAGYGDDPRMPNHYFSDPVLDNIRVTSTTHCWDNEAKYIERMLYCGAIRKDLTRYYTNRLKNRPPSSISCHGTTWCNSRSSFKSLAAWFHDVIY